MAWLFLDTHERGQSRVGWIENQTSNLKPLTSNLQKLEGSAGLVLTWLARQQEKLKAADGICVVAGPGSFSSVRTGILYANLLARLLHLPLVGVTVDEARDQSVLSEKLLDTRYSILDTRYVAPLYDAEPNITIPRSS